MERNPCYRHLKVSLMDVLGQMFIDACLTVWRVWEKMSSVQALSNISKGTQLRMLRKVVSLLKAIHA